MIVDLHKHAGHDLSIGHNADYSATILWCDRCDSLIMGVPNDSQCPEDHVENDPAVQSANKLTRSQRVQIARESRAS